MEVKKIIKNVATMLQLNDVKNYLTNEVPLTDEVNNELELILACVNFVNNTIASTYISLKKTLPVSTNDGIIKFSSLTNSTILSIISVKDNYDNKLIFKVYDDHIKTSVGSVLVRFAYFPSDVLLTDSITYYQTKLTDRIFAYGVAAEYLFIKGNVDDSAMWDERFKTALMSIRRPLYDIKLNVNGG